MLESLQASGLARVIAESQMLTASLSAVHLLGFTLVMSAAVVSNLRLVGLLLADVPASDVSTPASRLALAGLLTSLVTGALLFAPRAAGAAANPFFRAKLACVLAGSLLQFLWQARAGSRESIAPRIARMTGAAGLALWLGAAVAACAFILLE